MTTANESSETLHSFLERLSSAAPTPGGGAVAALSGALAAALAHMVASLTAGKKKFVAVEAEFQAAMPGLKAAIARFTTLMDDDARAFDGVMAAMKLPKATPEEAAARDQTLRLATLAAAEAPMETLRLLQSLLPAVELAAAKGNPHAVSDAGMAALLVTCATRAAAMNVMINLKALPPADAAPLRRELDERTAATLDTAERIASRVESTLK